ncbi:MAG: peptidoglycan-binding domain-containing protein [bacterium]|nr:peptidoglycan-binding domain-containing protein [bacterium]
MGAIPVENQNLDFSKLTDNLKTTILNEYIKLDGDIKRYEYGLNTVDPLIFSNSLDTFYNQNAIKINTLENDYYLKTSKTKTSFLEYVDNNKELLNGLAQKMDSIELVKKHSTDTQKVFTSLNATIDARSSFWKNMLATKEKITTGLAADFDETIARMIAAHNPHPDIQAKYLIHKDNFMKKFKAESDKAVYYVFSAFFDYPAYLDLLEKNSELQKRFTDSSGKLDCKLLLTSSMSLAPYTNGIETKAPALIKGMKLIDDGIKNGKVKLKDLELPALTAFDNGVNKLAAELRKDFTLMLESETPAQPVHPETHATPSTPELTPSAPSQATPPAKTTFTQAFTKNQYHPQVKVLQNYLHSQGLYQGTINGIYSPATIEAVYQFQLKHGIVTGKEKNKAGYGWFGTQTRAKLNSLI